jgi:hypothetical protein
MAERVRSDGKFFALGNERFQFRGITYGTFKPRSDGERFPERDQVARDAAHIAANDFTVVRTYTAPPEDVVGWFADAGVRTLAGVFYADWRYMIGSSRRQLRRIVSEAVKDVV